MANSKLTTVQMDMDTDRKLNEIALAHERSKMAQIRYWVNRDYAELERLKLLPSQQARIAARSEAVIE